MKETKQSHDQFDLSSKEGALEAGVNKAMQITIHAVDDLGILAGKYFSVTSGILEKRNSH